MKEILKMFLLWRALLFVPVILGFFFIPYRAGYNYTSPLHFTESVSKVLNALLYPWGNFDGIYYLLIAAHGYTSSAGFFPLFPMVLHAFAGLDPLRFFLSLIVSNAIFAAALFVFYKLVRLDCKEEVAKNAVLFLLLFPTSFFFASIFSEGLFLLLSVASFYLARKKKWLLASIIASLLGATRVVGIFILPALILEFLLQEAKERKPGVARRALPLLLIPLGLIGYMLFNFTKWGNALYFVKVQGEFLNNREVSTIVLFPQTIVRYIKIFFTVSPIQYEFWIALFEFVTFSFVILLFYLAWKKKVRVSYLIFALLCFLIPVSTGTLSGLPRYAIILFPLFIGLALFPNKILRRSYIIIASLLLFLSLLAFSRGYFIS